MRKIESEMLAAINAMRHNNSDASWHNGNTNVTNRSTAEGNATTIYLHSHNIACIDGDGSLRVSLCGWDTVTTRSRLSAIVRAVAEERNAARGPMSAEQIEQHANGTAEFRYPRGLGVSSRKGIVRLHDARGETQIDDSGWHSVEL